MCEGLHSYLLYAESNCTTILPHVNTSIAHVAFLSSAAVKQVKPSKVSNLAKEFAPQPKKEG